MSEKRCLWRSAGMGGDWTTECSEKLPSMRFSLMLTSLCGAVGAMPRKKGFWAAAASSRKAYAFSARTSVEYSPSQLTGAS